MERRRLVLLLGSYVSSYAEPGSSLGTPLSLSLTLSAAMADGPRLCTRKPYAASTLLQTQRFFSNFVHSEDNSITAILCYLFSSNSSVVEEKKLYYPRRAIVELDSRGNVFSFHLSSCSISSRFPRTIEAGEREREKEDSSFLKKGRGLGKQREIYSC